MPHLSWATSSLFGFILFVVYWCELFFQDVPDELVLMAERYEKHKMERQTSGARGGGGGGGGERWGRRDGGARGGRDRGQDWRFWHERARKSAHTAVLVECTLYGLGRSFAWVNRVKLWKFWLMFFFFFLHRLKVKRSFVFAYFFIVVTHFLTKNILGFVWVKDFLSVVI